MLAAGRRPLIAAFFRAPRLAPCTMAKRKASPTAGDGSPAAAAADPAPEVAEAAGPTAAEDAGPASAAAKPKAKKRAVKPPPPPPGPLYDPATMRPPRLEASDGSRPFRILSWNVAGLRALLKKDPGALAALVEAESPDVVCLQEHKLQEAHCGDAGAALAAALPGWAVHWNCSVDKKGYSGTAILSRGEPLSVQSGIGDASHDGEGRVVTAEFPDLVLVNVYVPNAGEGLKRLEYRVNEWDVKFSEYLKALGARTGKPVVLTGDLNCAHREIDIHSPKTNLRSAGFTPEERESFEKNLLGAGFVDAFRAAHPGVVAYTYWGYRFNARANNKGWRLDYFLVDGALAGRVHDCFHLPGVTGSDHCPLGLVLKL